MSADFPIALNETDAPQAEIWTGLRETRLLAMDVDGVLTDGAVIFDDAGREQKRFHVADGLGLVLMRLMGVEGVWITGRVSSIVARRAEALRVELVLQGVRDKGAALAQIIEERGLSRAAVAYVGDDWNDLPALALAGTPIAVANAAGEVKAAARYVTQRSGGQGAIREVCEALLDARGEREVCLQRYLNSLREPRADGDATRGIGQ